MPAPVGIHSITKCVEECGRYVRPKRMAAETAAALVKEHFGEDAVVVINTGKGICSNCRKYPSTLTNAEKSPEVLAAEQARKDRIAAERLAAARLAADTIARQRMARTSRVRRVSMGQSMVRI